MIPCGFCAYFLATVANQVLDSVFAGRPPAPLSGELVDSWVMQMILTNGMATGKGNTPLCPHLDGLQWEPNNVDRQGLLTRLIGGG